MTVRSRLRARLCAAALAAGAAFAAFAELRETVLTVPVVAENGQVDAIALTLFRPQGAGPFPVAVLSHGSPRDPLDRRRTGRIRFAAQSQAFLDQGFAVAIPTRRGYGDSGGRWAESYGSCEDPDYHRAGLETARDIRAAIQSLRGVPSLVAGPIVLVGQSAGGWGSVAASTLPIEGLVAVVNFAGGRGSFAPDAVCGEERLVEAATRYGQRSRVPQLWIYSENDHYFGPRLARRLHSAFVASGGRAEFLAASAVGADGHSFFGFVEGWVDPVREFLRRALETAGPGRPAVPANRR